MWDSAKKSIKIRSVLQSNGMRHFIVNEESEEIYLQTLRKNTKNETGDSSSSSSSSRKGNHTFPSYLQRSNSFTSSTESHEGTDFFGVAGSKICNSKKHKSHHPHSRYFCGIMQPEMEFERGGGRCPHLNLKSDMLDLIPVKSPVIKKLITNSNSGGGSGRIGSMEGKSYLKGKGGTPSSSSASTTLCSRIMTWIDLEVKRNATRGRSSVPFSSADLNIVNELNMPYEAESCGSSTSSESTSGSGSSSYGTSSSGSGSTSNAVSLPKLVPCWRKERKEEEGANKSKKSVRISEDLPKWGKMKRRLRKKDRSWSLNELYDDEFDDLPRSSRRQDFLSTSDSLRDDDKDKNNDAFLVCDENNVMGTGRLQVHIFLPQTESTVTASKLPTSGNGNYDDSTS